MSQLNKKRRVSFHGSSFRPVDLMYTAERNNVGRVLKTSNSGQANTYKALTKVIILVLAMIIALKVSLSSEKSVDDGKLLSKATESMQAGKS